MAKKGSDYFGLGRIVSLILAIFPLTCWILGVITRFQEKKYVAGIIRLFLTFPVIWIVDIIFMAMDKKICRLLNM